MWRLKLLCFSVLLALAGCAGVPPALVPDPGALLDDALERFAVRSEPLVAERLIRQSIALCDERGDSICLAEGYRVYAFFLGSASVEGQWRRHYQQHGFLDKSVRFEARHVKAAAHFEKSRSIYVGLDLFEAARNASLNLAQTYRLLGDVRASCRSLDEALFFQREVLRSTPHFELVWPVDFSSFDEWLLAEKKEVGCV